MTLSDCVGFCGVVAAIMIWAASLLAADRKSHPMPPCFWFALRIASFTALLMFVAIAVLAAGYSRTADAEQAVAAIMGACATAITAVSLGVIWWSVDSGLRVAQNVTSRIIPPPS